MNFYEINKGPGMLWGWSYVMPMMSHDMTLCDIIGMIEGVGWVSGVGVGHFTCMDLLQTFTVNWYSITVYSV